MQGCLFISQVDGFNTVRHTRYHRRMLHEPSTPKDLVGDLKRQAQLFGFDGISIAHFTALEPAAEQLKKWLAKGLHGTMDYMEKNAAVRARPDLILPGATCAILVRMAYLTDPKTQINQHLVHHAHPLQAQVSLYAQGRDYHKVLRQRLGKIADTLSKQYPSHQFRAFTDSAPVMEVALANASGLGWRGKHSLLIHREAGSFFFLGGILSTLDLPATPPVTAHCGQCNACIQVCPTQAIIAPYTVDARRCISYLTIEHEGVIEEALRPPMGNKIYGCDDCQTVCPWNKFATPSPLTDFSPRNGLNHAQLLEVWAWTEQDFDTRLLGSPIRRIGYARWLRNIATAMGNAIRQMDATQGSVLKAALKQRIDHPNDAVRVHVAWALAQSHA